MGLVQGRARYPWGKITPRPLWTDSLIVGAWLSQYSGSRVAPSSKADALKGESLINLRGRSEHLGCGRTDFLSGFAPYCACAQCGVHAFARYGGGATASDIIDTR